MHKFKVMVGTPFYFTLAGSKYCLGNNTHKWGVGIYPVYNNEAQEHLYECHTYPVRPTKRQLRKLKKIAYIALFDDLDK